MNIEQLFERILIDTYHYPAESIRINDGSENVKYDLAVYKGTVPIQFFDLKIGTYIAPKQHGHFQSQRLKAMSIYAVVPIFTIVFDTSGTLKEIYLNGKLLQKDIVKEQLNYPKAVARMVEHLQHETENIISFPFKFLCGFFSSVMFVYWVIYVLADCGVLSIQFSAITTPFVIFYGIIAILALTPSLLNMLRNVRKLKLWSLEIELNA